MKKLEKIKFTFVFAVCFTLCFYVFRFYTAEEADIPTKSENFHLEPQQEIRNISIKDGLRLDDECACRLLPNISIHPGSTCGLLSTLRGQHQQIISFSFYFGNKLETDLAALCDLTPEKSQYLAGVKANLEKIKKFYPGYFIRIYHDAPLNYRCKVSDELCNLFCPETGVMDLCNTKNIESYPHLEQSFGMLWRFAPMADPYVDEWHSRDLDAVMLQREVDAVQDWKKSNFTFHIMRDHPQHLTDILGGMFGIKQDTPDRKSARLSEFNSIIKDFGKIWQKGSDQKALAKIIAPHAAVDSLVHDSYLCNSGFLKGSKSVGYPTKRSGNQYNVMVPNFVGNTGKDGIHIECPVDCRPANHKDWKFC